MVGACVTVGPVAPCTSALPPSAIAHASRPLKASRRPPIVLENNATSASRGCTRADTKMALNATRFNSSTCPGGRLYPGIGGRVHGPPPPRQRNDPPPPRRFSPPGDTPPHASPPAGR